MALTSLYALYTTIPKTRLSTNWPAVLHVSYPAYASVSLSCRLVLHGIRSIRDMAIYSRKDWGSVLDFLQSPAMEAYVAFVSELS